MVTAGCVSLWPGEIFNIKLKKGHRASSARLPLRACKPRVPVPRVPGSFTASESLVVYYHGGRRRLLGLQLRLSPKLLGALSTGSAL